MPDETPHDFLSENLKYLFDQNKKLGRNKQHFYDVTGIAPSTISRWKSGKREISRAMVQQVLTYFNQYLGLGLTEADLFEVDLEGISAVNQNPEEIRIERMAALFRMLNPAKQEKLLEFMETLKD